MGAWNLEPGSFTLTLKTSTSCFQKCQEEDLSPVCRRAVPEHVSLWCLLAKEDGDSAGREGGRRLWTHHQRAQPGEHRNRSLD